MKTFKLEKAWAVIGSKPAMLNKMMNISVKVAKENNIVILITLQLESAPVSSYKKTNAPKPWLMTISIVI